MSTCDALLVVTHDLQPLLDVDHEALLAFRDLSSALTILLRLR